jgi:hypothetical protein
MLIEFNRSNSDKWQFSTKGDEDWLIDRDLSVAGSLMIKTVGIDGRCRGRLIVTALLVSLGTASFALPPVTQDLLVALDGKAVTTSGASVTNWNDQSALGGAQNFVAGTAPTLVSRYAMPSGATHNVISFNGVNNYLQVTNDPAFATNTLSWFLVVQPDTTNAIQVLLRAHYTSQASAWGNIQGSTSSRVYSEGRTSSGVQVVLNSPNFFWNTNRWYVLSTVLDGGTGAIRAKFLDSNGNTGTASASTANATLTDHLYTRLGYNTSVSHYWFAGRMAEVLIYKRALSVDDQESVLAYLVKKYFGPPSPLTGTLILVQ